MIDRIMELSNKDKKVARAILERGLLKEFAKGLLDADSVLHDWKINERNNRDSYHLLYKTITDFDEHIAKRYDGMTGSKYALIIAEQLIDGMITEEDLSEFSEGVKQAILQFVKM